jgi:hypothetical protein
MDPMVSEFMSEAEAVSKLEMRHHIFVHRDRSEVTRQECIDAYLRFQARDRDDGHLEVEFDDLLNGGTDLSEW